MDIMPRSEENPFTCPFQAWFHLPAHLIELQATQG